MNTVFDWYDQIVIKAQKLSDGFKNASIVKL